MFSPDADGVYVRLSASPARRMFAVGVLGGLGVVMLLLALGPGIAPPSRFALIVLAGLTIVQADRLRRATLAELLLTADGLVDDSGRVLALMRDIVRVERGVFALKPSNGFTLVLNSRAARAWAPGLWWRIGRRVGVGGVVPSGPAKVMAECIAMRLATDDTLNR